MEGGKGNLSTHSPFRAHWSSHASTSPLHWPIPRGEVHVPGRGPQPCSLMASPLFPALDTSATSVMKMNQAGPGWFGSVVKSVGLGTEGSWGLGEFLTQVRVLVGGNKLISLSHADVSLSLSPLLPFLSTSTNHWGKYPQVRIKTNKPGCTLSSQGRFSTPNLSCSC